MKNRLGGMVGKVLQFSLDRHSLVLSDITYCPDMEDAAVADDSMRSTLDSIGGMQSDLQEIQANLSSL